MCDPYPHPPWAKATAAIARVKTAANPKIDVLLIFIGILLSMLSDHWLPLYAVP
jgi:hypothetical protein